MLSLLLAALYLLEQRDIKRLLAYSSVEHMGILAIGISFGAPIALSGVLLHVLAHAAAKGNAFMGAGVLVRKFGTKELSRMTRGIELLPWSGPLFLIAVLALSAMPPFGLFRSEFQIVYRWFRPRPQCVDRRAGVPGDAGIPGSEPGDDTDFVSPRTRRFDRCCVGTDPWGTQPMDGGTRCCRSAGVVGSWIGAATRSGGTAQFRCP